MQDEAVKARYVKVHSTRAATGYGVKIRELEVYSNSPLAPAELRHIEIAADATAGHVKSNYNFTVTMIDQYGETYTLAPDETAEWVVSGGAMTGNAFKADAKGAYTVKYKVGEIESNEVTINIVAEGENILAGKTIVSTSEGDNYQIDRPVANVIDGNDGSDWFIKDVNNSTTFTAEFVADFGDVANVDAVHLHFEGANSCDYCSLQTMKSTPRGNHLLRSLMFAIVTIGCTPTAQSKCATSNSFPTKLQTAATDCAFGRSRHTARATDILQAVSKTLTSTAISILPAM